MKEKPEIFDTLRKKKRVTREKNRGKESSEENMRKREICGKKKDRIVFKIIEVVAQ